MSHTLISFLGKSQRTDGRYRTATYDFGEGVTRTTSFFSMGLKEVINPDKLIILGTSGSMWDVLCGELSQDENDLEALMAAVDTNTVTQVLLDTYQVLISEHLAVDCQLRLISYGDSADGQVQILQAMAKDVKQGERNYSQPYKNFPDFFHYMIDFCHTNIPLSNETERSRFTTN